MKFQNSKKVKVFKFIYQSKHRKSRLKYETYRSKLKNAQKILTIAKLGHFKKLTNLRFKYALKPQKSEVVKNVSKSI